MLQDPLAEKLLGGEIKDGTRVKVGAAADRLIFETSLKSATAQAA
jgi:ATP-dependent Clp protease ATP-binding subunit ClpB